MHDSWYEFVCAKSHYRKYLLGYFLKLSKFLQLWRQSCSPKQIKLTRAPYFHRDAYTTIAQFEHQIESFILPPNHHWNETAEPSIQWKFQRFPEANHAHSPNLYSPISMLTAQVLKQAKKFTLARRTVKWITPDNSGIVYFSFYSIRRLFQVKISCWKFCSLRNCIFWNHWQWKGCNWKKMVDV